MFFFHLKLDICMKLSIYIQVCVYILMHKKDTCIQTYSVSMCVSLGIDQLIYRSTYSLQNISTNTFQHCVFLRMLCVLSWREDRVSCRCFQSCPWDRLWQTKSGSSISPPIVLTVTTLRWIGWHTRLTDRPTGLMEVRCDGWRSTGCDISYPCSSDSCLGLAGNP